MKYNTTKKEVNVYDRILCFLLALSVASLLVLCTFRPFTACAIGEVDNIASDINNFYEDCMRELDRVERAVASDINNGTVDASSAIGREYMAALALQAAVVNDPVLYSTYLLAHAYNDSIEEANKFISYLQNNPTITFSGTGGVGLYKISGYNDIRIANLHFYDNAYFSEGKIPLVTSNDFEVYFNLSETSVYNCTASITEPYYNFSCGGNWWSISVWTSNNCGFEDIRNWGPQAGRYLITSSIPVLSSFPEFSTTGNGSICGSVVSEDLPVDSCPTDSPWIYYNETVLPYMQTNFPNVPTNYYMFPHGYHEAEPDPTEPPLFPFTQPWDNEFIYEQTETSISIINPTATNESGTTYTETTIVDVPVTEISSSYTPVYGFNVPLLPNLETVTATLPAETIPPQTAQKITDLWAFVKWILDESGMFPIFLALVSIGFVMFIIRFIGG